MNQQRKKVLFLMTRLPMPTDDGRSLTLKQYSDMLMKNYDLGIISMQCKKDIDKQSNDLKFVEILNYPSFFGKVMNVIFLSFFGGEPLQVSGVYSKKSQKKFDKIVADYKPDVIICDMIRTSRYLRKCKVSGFTKILDMDDLLSKRCLESKGNSFGQFKEVLPKKFVKIIDVLHLNKIILNFEMKKLRKSEIKSVNHFDKVILVSSIEAEELRNKVNTNNVVCWPPCIKNINEEKYLNYNPKQLIFLGNLLVAQNQTSLEYLCESILPILDDSYNLLVLGKCEEDYKSKFSIYPNVKFTGYVESLESYLTSSLCLISPIQFGTGIKIKILEGMGYGVPVITSKVGVEGLNVLDKKEILIANSPNQYVENILWLQESNNREFIIKNAIKYIKQNHSYEFGEKIMLTEVMN